MSYGVKTVRRFLTAALAFLVFLGGAWLFTGLLAAPVSAVVGTNEQINFQGRLFNAQGAVVPDGYYNVQFKIYQDGDGLSVGNTTGSPAGSLKWTESWLNVNGKGVLVKNGYMSVELGSVTAFGSQVDWNQSVLWLSMNIGSTNASCASFGVCAPDGEMVPMKRFSSTPYAMNAGKLGGLTSAGFIQNQNAAAQTTSNFWIDGSGRAATLQAGTSVITPAIRAAADSTTALQIQNAAGSSTVMTIDTVNSRLAVGTASPPTATLQVAGTLTSAGGAISLNDSSNFAVSIGGGTSTGTLTVGNAANTTTLGSNTINVGSATAATTISKTDQTTTNTSGTGLTVRGAGGNGTGGGGQVSIQGGNGGATNANGGNILLSGGAGTGTGIGGLVVVTTPTFQTAATDANCYTSGALVAASCTISATSVNNNSAVIVGFSASGQTATLPNPGITTAGRIVYVTAANSSQEFTLSVNGGGVGNLIAMRQNTSATMIWSGSAWTAAGASSSTTLQSAYDSTLQSAGGAELVVSKTSSTNGLTIRDSSTAPVNGTLLSVQTSSAATLLSVNSNVKEYASNAGAEVAGGSATTFPVNTWEQTAVGTTVSRNNTAGDYVATGQGSVMVQTAATGNVGVKNTLTSALTANTTYNVSFATRLLSGTLTGMNVHYSDTGSGVTQACTLATSSVTSVWSKVNCTFTTPASGITAGNAIYIRQGGAVARTIYIDNLSVTIAADYNFATDGNVSDNTNFSTNWLTAGLGTVGITRNTGDGYNASDSAQAAVTTGAANAGIRNKLRTNPLPDTLYRVTVYAKLMSGAAFTDFKVRYSRDGSTTAGGNYVDCVDYNTQTLVTTGWTKVTCYIKTDVTTATNPHVYFAETASAVRTFAVDAFSMTLRTSTTPNVQIGGGVNGGPTTLLTLDKGASAPIASDNDALLGSMYYDTSLGKLQCYEADGWGACGSSPDNVVTISPEYTNAVLHGTGIGTMTSDICSDTLNLNDGSSSQPTICGTNETYNFYKWTSPQAAAQTYGIYVTYQLPSTFKEFSSGQTSLMARTDSANSSVTYQIYRSDATGLTACGSAVSVSTGVQTTWQTAAASGAADPSTCSFTAGNSVVFKINVSASNTANAYVGNLNFIYSNR